MAEKRSLIDRARDLRDWVALPPQVKRAVKCDRRESLTTDPGIDASVAATVEWLCAAQSHSATSDGGVARHYSLLDGWGASYPETTGYIVPTLLAYSRRTGDHQLLQRCRRMLDWFVSIQLEGGGFQGGTTLDCPVVPVVFNTGQILMGLAAGSSEFGQPYTEAMHLAATWLVEVQDEDGNWRRHNSPFAMSGDKTYDTHTAWGLLEAARSSGEMHYAHAALRNIRWALSKQQSNGWFADCCLNDPARPLTHTLGYTLKGIIEGHLYSEDQQLLSAARLSADALAARVEHNGRLAGRFDQRWTAKADWVCLTGSVQIAQCMLQLYQCTEEDRYLQTAKVLNRYVRSTVSVVGPIEVRGGVRGSFPIDGEYGRYQYLNWAAKFFIDSNLLEHDIVGGSV